MVDASRGASRSIDAPDVFDGVYVINMDRATQRMEAMTRQCERLGLRCQRFPAVDGSKLPPEVLERDVAPVCRHLCTPAMIGIALSHMRIWQLAIRNGHERTLVLEDDATLVPDFVVRARQALEDVPDDYDVLLLGCFMFCERNRKYLSAKRLVGPIAQLVGRNDARAWGSVYVPEYFAGAHAYIVSQKGARKLAELIPRASYHIDMCMNHPDVTLYAAGPDLAFQTDNANSTNALLTFPKTLGPALDRALDEKGMSVLFLTNTGMGRVGPVTINVWTAVFLVLGMYRRTLPYVAGVLLAELVLGADVTSVVAAYAVGWALRAAASRARRA